MYTDVIIITIKNVDKWVLIYAVFMFKTKYRFFFKPFCWTKKISLAFAKSDSILDHFKRFRAEYWKIYSRHVKKKFSVCRLV